jgi:hypothetical protein
MELKRDVQFERQRLPDGVDMDGWRTSTLSRDGDPDRGIAVLAQDDADAAR